MSVKNHEELFPRAFAEQLPLADPERGELLESLLGPASVAVRIHPAKAEMTASSGQVPWCADGHYLDHRPRFSSDPAWHAGGYYVQEASSMFLDHVVRMLHLHEAPIAALDLCAAPGGKSTLLRSALHADSFLLANEVVSTRLNLLEENLTRWGVPGYAISQSDPVRFSALEDTFDLLVADAPCSGEGLFRKDSEAINHWSPQAVAECTARQERILESAWPALKAGGYLVYSTCTFNLSENEERMAHMMRKYGAESVDIALPFDGIVRSEVEGCIGYRFYPHRVRGEGFFCSILRKADHNKSRHAVHKVKSRYPVLAAISPGSGLTAIADSRGNVFAVNELHIPLINTLSNALNLICPGHETGQYLRGTFKPGQGLANLLGGKPIGEHVGLGLEDALQYLSRSDINGSELPDGLHMAAFEGFRLGMLRAQRGRLVSQYPMKWRLRDYRPEEYTPLVKWNNLGGPNQNS